MVRGLLQAAAYPEPTGKIDLVQTQMSFVFITDSFVYKVKKPVNLGYLDYSTPAKRHFFSQKEVELNQRLCPDVYLGVVDVTERDGSFSFGSKGKAVDHAVKMRRLPADRMMDALLEEGRVTPPMIDRLAEKLAEFHQRAEASAAISAFGGLDTISRNVEENFSQTEKYISQAISGDKFDRIRDYSRRFIKEKGGMLVRRVEQGHIRDLHGDLHAAHINFGDGICIYDCIEFNDRFRYGDVAAEVAFLAMDLDHYGRADLARLFTAAYIKYSRDEELAGLLRFYKSYRAYVRGKVNSFRLDDAYINEREREEARETAASYFDLADYYVKPKPTLFITVGLVGSGKSALAQALAGRLGLVVLASDVIRKRLVDIPVTEHRFGRFETGIYTPDFSRKTYDTMFAEARSILADGDSVILDASFIQAGDRLAAQRLATETGADFLVIECALDENTTKKRLQERSRQASVSDGRWEIYGPQKKKFEPVVEIAAPNRVIIDTSKPVSESVRQILARIDEA
jgi:aminoglycoside phosphotransferase family enzyme/adenylate kinase family enzyme